MRNAEPWEAMAEAIAFATTCILDDPDPLNDRELADGQRYVTRILRAVTESALLDLDFERPAFISMMEPVRHLGAAGPDIDYDVAILAPGCSYRISGVRGEAAYAGIVVYGSGGEGGASAILASVDIDDLAADDGSFSYDIDQPDAARVIVRQYFHDRDAQAAGSWEIERTDAAASQAGTPAPPHPAIVGHQIANAAATLRWNAQLNRLWTPERRDRPHEFVRQDAGDIVAAVPNPDVTYSFTWWRLADGEALELEVAPPSVRYWSVQLCDRWFQSYPQRQSNLNDRQVHLDPDGRVRMVVAATDPGVANWLDTGGHSTGVVFFRWLHGEPAELPTCRVVQIADLT